MIDRSGPFAFLDGHGTQLVLNQVDDLADDISLTEIVIEVDDPRKTLRRWPPGESSSKWSFAR